MQPLRFLRYTLFFFIFLAGCIFEERIPLHGEGMELKQTQDEIVLSVNFSGNEIPKESSAQLELRNAKDNLIYNREFRIQQDEFKKINSNKTILERYIKLNTSTLFSYAKLTIRLPNETFEIAQGEKKNINDEISAEVIAHETQYALHIAFKENGKSVTPAGTMVLAILDNDGQIYTLQKKVSEVNYSNGNLIFLLPYTVIPKSFYQKGNLIVTFNEKQKRVEIPLKQYTTKEAKEVEEQEFVKTAQALSNYTEYVGFAFNMTRAGYSTTHNPERIVLIRFDGVVNNLLPRPQYLIRDDFYIKDNQKVFYPVYGKYSTAFGPLLKGNEQVNASFYFLITVPKEKYYFYYGDKVLAVLDNN